jgi:signal transduction histidine kinase
MIEWQTRCEALEQELARLLDAVTHDLRAPLRAAEGFSRALLARHADVLAPEGRDYLQRIRDAAAEMGTRLSALVRLSRIAALPLTPASVDLAVVARQTIDRLRAAEPDRRVQVSIAESLPVSGDAALLEALLAALLGNAWRFTAAARDARIEVGRASEALFVRDNGAGFDLPRARHLFEPFGRLHPDDEPVHQGVGLAIARRIVHRHGGRIWAEAAVGAGATFWFTLQGETPAG